MSGEDAALSFDPLRPRLSRIAYRMLGPVADAEDVVQDAFLRWLDADRGAILEPEAYLRRVVTRLCLDQLKSARRRRETYIGPWLPEPLVEADEDEIDDVTLPLMLALERLSPLERAAFLLHDVFGVGFEEVAETIGREPATCRQLQSRAGPCARRASALSDAQGARPRDRRCLLLGHPKRRYESATLASRGGRRPLFRRRRQEARSEASSFRH
jgi:RNA polymerase sigma-70 factor, ECF subfamily